MFGRNERAHHRVGREAGAATKAAARLSSSDRATLVIVGDSSKFIDKLRALRPHVEMTKADELVRRAEAQSKLRRGVGAIDF